MMSHWRERAAYKEQLSDLSSKPGRLLKSREIPPYFGWTFGLPPGLPGGGMTGLSPVSGVGARISGSTPEGGHSTPFDLASLSPSASFDWPTVAPCCAFMPGFVGAHLLARAAPARAQHRPPPARLQREEWISSACRQNGAGAPKFPPDDITFFGNGSARNAPSAASGAVRRGGHRRVFRPI